MLIKIFIAILVLSSKVTHGKDYPFSMNSKDLSGLSEIILKNTNKNDDLMFYPLYISNIKNRFIKIIRDKCAYRILKPNEKCSFLYKSDKPQSNIKIRDILKNHSYTKNVKNKINFFKKNIPIINIDLNSIKNETIKLGLGNKYIIQYTSSNINLFKELNELKINKICNESFCVYTIELVPEEETNIILNTGNIKYKIFFSLRKSKNITIKDKNIPFKKFINGNSVSLVEHFTSGLPKKSLLHPSLYEITVYSNTVKNNSHLEITIEHSQKNTKEKIYLYDTFPFSTKEVFISNKETLHINLDNFEEYMKIENNGTLILSSAFNLSVIGISNLINNGKIIFNNGNKIQKEISIVYDKKKYQRKKFKCHHLKKCVYLLTDNIITGSGNLEANKAIIYNNFESTGYILFDDTLKNTNNVSFKNKINKDTFSFFSKAWDFFFKKGAK
jgi:hypothetical protein